MDGHHTRTVLGLLPGVKDKEGETFIWVCVCMMGAPLGDQRLVGLTTLSVNRIPLPYRFAPPLSALRCVCAATANLQGLARALMERSQEGQPKDVGFLIF